MIRIVLFLGCFLVAEVLTFALKTKREVTSSNATYENCGYKEFKYNYRIGGNILDEILLATYENPEGANGKTYDENLNMCYERCLENPRCTAIERTPSYSTKRKCYLKDGVDFSFKWDWMSRIRILNCDTYCEMGHGEYNMGRSGDILDRFSISVSKSNQNYDVYLNRCKKACMDREDCTGVQVAITSEKYYGVSRVCFLMNGWYVYNNPGTEQFPKECIRDRKPKPEPDEYDCKLGVSESDRRIDGSIIDKVTLVSEDGNMDNYEENLDLCYEKCLAHDDCGGIQINPSSWTERECRLMDGRQTYSRVGWTARIKTCEKINKHKPRPGYECEMSNIMTYNFARDGRILSQISLPPSYADEFKEVLEQCYENCLNHRDCTGITTTQGDQECFAVDGKTTYERQGWKIRNKLCSKKKRGSDSRV